MNPKVVYEIQVSENGEAYLPKSLSSCTKNPGHKQFIPIAEFGVKHLPDCCRDNDVVDLVRSLADVTVKVSVAFTSPKRPDVFPDTETPYPCAEHRGKRVLTTGTGWVWRVFIFRDTSLGITCPCRNCKESGRPSEVWGEIQLYTSAHVVFDEDEARNASCWFFYDSEESSPVKLEGWRVQSCDVKQDRCLVVCETCDSGLLEKVEKMQFYWWDQWDKVNSKYKNAQDVDPLTIIVSHPHGCPKKVSLGKVIRKSIAETESTGRALSDTYAISEVQNGGRASTYTYTTCTCPGSSGAHVYLLRGEEGWVYKHLHSGVDLENMNLSGPGGDFRYLT